MVFVPVFVLSFPTLKAFVNMNKEKKVEEVMPININEFFFIHVIVTYDNLCDPSSVPS